LAATEMDALQVITGEIKQEMEKRAQPDHGIIMSRPGFTCGER